MKNVFCTLALSASIILLSGPLFLYHSQGSKLEQDIKKAERRIGILRQDGRYLDYFLRARESEKVSYINSNWNPFTVKLKNRIRLLSDLDKRLETKFERLARGSRYRTVHKSTVSNDLFTLSKDKSFFERSYQKVKRGNTKIRNIRDNIRSYKGKACSTSDPKLSRKAYDRAKSYYDQIRSVYTPMTTAWKDMKARMAYSQKRKPDLDNICQEWVRAISGYDKARSEIYSDIQKLFLDIYFDNRTGKYVDTNKLLNRLEVYVSRADKLNREIRYLAGLHPSSSVLNGYAREADARTLDIRNKAASFKRLIPPNFQNVKSDISDIPKESKIIEKSKYRDLYYKARSYREWWGAIQLNYRLTQNHGRQAYENIQEIKRLMRETRDCVNRAIDAEENRSEQKHSFYISSLSYNSRTVNNGPRNDLTIYFRGNPKWPIKARLTAVKCPPGVRCPPVEMHFNASGARSSNMVVMPKVLYCYRFNRSQSIRAEVRLIDSAGNESRPKPVVTHCIVKN
jgi:hypothetical protein